MTHREAIKAYLGKLEFKDSKIVDWGSGTKPVQRYISLMENCEYLTIDKLDHVGADLVTNIEDFQNLPHKFDVAFCMEVIEHVLDPDDVLDNIQWNLKPGGLLYLSVPFLYEVHHTEDYWRFTDQGIKLLLNRNGFKTLEIIETVDQRGWIVKAEKKQ